MDRASSNFRQRLRSAAQRTGLRAFWQWWLGQLAPLVPGGLRTAVRRRRLRPIVAFEPDAAVVWAPRLADGSLAFAEVARVPLSGDPADVAKEGHAAIDALPRVAYGGVVTEARVAVSLPAARSCERRSRCRRPSKRISCRRSRTTSIGTRPSSPTKCISMRSSSGAIPRRRRSGSTGRLRSRRSSTRPDAVRKAGAPPSSRSRPNRRRARRRSLERR